LRLSLCKKTLSFLGKTVSVPLGAILTVSSFTATYSFAVSITFAVPLLGDYDFIPSPAKSVSAFAEALFTGFSVISMFASCTFEDPLI